MNRSRAFRAIRTFGGIVAGSLLLALATVSSHAQSGHRIYRVGPQFYLEDLSTGVSRPFDMWVSRLSNALFDTRYTDQVIRNLDDYKRYGINTIVVGIQGGNLQTGKNGLYPKVYNTDGTLDLTSVVWPSLRRLLAETDKRGIVMMIQYWYFLRDEQVPVDADALKTTRLVSQWLKATGHQHFVFDLANEFNHPAYTMPSNPSVKRPLFSTLTGALELFQEVKRVLPNAILGTSPPGGLAAPEGFLSGSGSPGFVSADIIIGHNTVADPNNPFSYRVGTIPQNPASKPYVNNEFDAQLGSEKYPKTNPLTGRLSYGHFEQRSVTRYVNDLQALMNLGGTGNVFSSHQQFVPPNDPIPDPSVGPEGTQPEATAGGAEPSVQWIFAAIAQLRKIGSLDTRDDFEDGLASGFFLGGPGQWSVTAGQLVQASPTTTLAWSRMVTDAGDVDIEFDAAFATAPTANQRIGILLGGATPAEACYRLRISATRVELDQLGGTLPPTGVNATKALGKDRYGLTVRDGTLGVSMNGQVLFTVPDANPIARRNLLFFTESAAATFDHVRTGPIRTTRFDDSTSGDWTPANASAWSFPLLQGSSSDRVWQAVVPTNGTEHAYLDRVLDDFRFDFVVDLSTAPQVALRFRATDPTQPTGEGYALILENDGDLRLERQSANGPAQTLAASRVAFQNIARIAVRVTVEGNRYQVRIDNAPAPILDHTETAPPLPDGGLSFVCAPGTTRLDTFRLDGGASAFPTITMTTPGGSPIPTDFKIVYSDPDGLIDLAGASLEVDAGAGFVDATFLLITIFKIKLGADGHSVVFELRNPSPIGNQRVRIRGRAFDHAGNTTVTTFQFN